MNSRKRHAHTLLPPRHPKQPRLTLNGYPSSAPSQNEKESLGSRWFSFGSGLMTLVGDTIHEVIPIWTRPETDDSDSSVNQASSDLVDSTSSASSTPRQSSLLLYPQAATPQTQTRPISPPPFSLDFQTSSTPTGPSGSKHALQPENIPLPPSPTKVTHTSPSTSTTVGRSLSYDSPNTSTAKLHESFTFSTSAGTPTRIPTHSPTSLTESVLQQSVVPSMRNLQLNGRSIPTSQASSDFSDSHRGSQTSRRSSQSSSKSNHLRRNPRKREHIYAKVHKADVKRHYEQLRRELYEIKRGQGYTSGYADFKGYLDYQRKLENIDFENVPLPLRPSAVGDKMFSLGRRRISNEDDDDAIYLQRAFDNAKATFNSPKPPKPFIPTLDQLQISRRSKDADIEKQLRPPIVPLPTSLPPDDEKFVKETLQKRGVVSKYAKEQVNQTDLSRLQPGQWLNDEIINFYGAMILGRSESSKENPSVAKGKKAQKSGPLNIHYFSSFFWAKLCGDGYEKGRLAKWTKKIDIFSKDLVLMPVNHGNAHWTAGVINFRAKRFESYDSMGMAKETVFRRLRDYVKHEHLNKKKKEFDFTGWEDWAPDSTPQQENGYDCGVFTCQFMETLARGEETFNFSQKDMPYLRRRMIWEIGKAQLRDDR